MFSYDIIACAAAETLDMYDFTSDIAFCKENGIRDPWDIREYIMDNHCEIVEDAVDDLSLEEFMEYLSARYGVRWEEIIKYRMY